MNVVRKFAFASLLLLIGSPAVTHATVISAELSLQESHYFVNPFPPPKIISFARVFAAAAPVFNVQFSALGEEVVRIDFLAPSGQAIFVDAPTSGWDYSYSLVGRYDFGTTGAPPGQFVDSSPSISLLSVSGAGPVSPTGSVYLTGPGGNNGSFLIDFGLSPGQSFSFAGFSIETTVPASYNVDFNLAGNSFELVGDVQTSSGEPADPGQWVYLAAQPVEAVPEPPVWGMLAGGLLAFLAVRRSRSRAK